MTTCFAQHATAARGTEHRVGTGAWLLRGLKSALKAVQYGQMVSVLNRLPDTYLMEAGLRRCDIPQHARRLIYGDD